MTKEAQPWFAPTGENFDFGSFILLKTAYRNQVSQALYLGEFLETYDDEVVSNLKTWGSTEFLGFTQAENNSVKNSANGQKCNRNKRESGIL